MTATEQLNRLVAERAELQARAKECTTTAQGHASRDAFDIALAKVSRAIDQLEQRGGVR